MLTHVMLPHARLRSVAGSGWSVRVFNVLPRVYRTVSQVIFVLGFGCNTGLSAQDITPRCDRGVVCKPICSIPTGDLGQVVGIAKQGAGTALV